MYHMYVLLVSLVLSLALYVNMYPVPIVYLITTVMFLLYTHLTELRRGPRPIRILTTSMVLESTKLLVRTGAYMYTVSMHECCMHSA